MNIAGIGNHRLMRNIIGNLITTRRVINIIAGAPSRASLAASGAAAAAAFLPLFCPKAAYDLIMADTGVERSA